MRLLDWLKGKGGAPRGLDDPSSDPGYAATPDAAIRAGSEALERGDPTAALAFMDRATQLGLAPTSAVHRMRAEAYALLKRFDEAIAEAGRAIELSPEEPWGLALRGALLKHLGRFAEARKDFTRALRFHPEDRHALCQLAWVLAAAPDDAVRDGPRARSLAEKAVAQPDAPDGAALDCLSAALAECGDFAGATARLKEARGRGVPDEAGADARAALYAAGKPYRLPQGLR